LTIAAEAIAAEAIVAEAIGTYFAAHLFLLQLRFDHNLSEFGRMFKLDTRYGLSVWSLLRISLQC